MRQARAGANRRRTDAAGGADRAGAELGEERGLVLVGDGGDDVDEAGDAAERVLLAEFGAELVQGHRRPRLVRLDELCGDPRGHAEEELGLGGACRSVEDMADRLRDVHTVHGRALDHGGQR
jgi:hypothetical protein